MLSQGTHHHSAHERSLSAEFQKRRKGLLLRAGEDDAACDAGPLAVVEVRHLLLHVAHDQHLPREFL